ncbi:MAG: DUF58 domain-containing protein [Dehalococcoidia bacterium]|nr:DUF58 domain-containing protein [Dehalococcoidia bacterium]
MAAAPLPLTDERVDPTIGGVVTPELLAQVRRIEIRARRLTSTLLSGDYRSIFRGTGIEFADAREYVPGDDVRRIDWNVTARMGTPWVKEFVEERELAVVCAVDLSASQLVGRPQAGRLGVAAELTALLGFAAVNNQDRAGLMTFSDRVERFVPPARGARHVLRLVREVLLHAQPDRATDITLAVDYLARVLGRRSAVFLISDFFAEGYIASLRTLARRHEVIALVLVDPVDLELPDARIVEMQPVEGGPRVLLDTSDAGVRARYAEAAQRRARERRLSLSSAGVDHVEIRLDQDPVAPLAAYFRRRALTR